MPKLSEVSAKLEIGPLVEALLSASSGPKGVLQGASSPVSTDQLAAASSGAANLDSSGITASIVQVASQALPLLAGLPGAGDVVRPITTTLELVEGVTVDDLPGQLRTLVERLTQELAGSHPDGLLGVLLRVSALVGESKELTALISLVAKLAGLSGLDFRGVQPLAETIPAFVGTARSVGALMALESSLAEGERLTTIMSQQLDSDKIARAAADLRAAFGSDGATLAAFVGSIDVNDAAQSAAASEALRLAVEKLSLLETQLSESLGFGEATLVHLGVDQMQAEVEAAAGLLRSVDPAPVTRAVQGLVSVLGPVLNLPPLPSVGGSFDALLTHLEGVVADFAGRIRAVDVAPIGDPVSRALGRVTSVISSVVDVLNQITSAARAALDQIQKAVASLPFDRIAGAVQSALEPVSAVMKFLQGLIDDVGAALSAVAGTVTQALGEIETTVDTFQHEVELLLKGAADFVDGLHLDQVVGSIAGNVNAFANTLAQAQMKPYFDTAVDVVGTAADAFEALPLNLLPDSIKQEVDAAAAPIRAIDVAAVEAEVESWFAISEDGQFELRGPLVEALTELQQKFDALLAEVKQRDPRSLAAPIEAELSSIVSQIDGLFAQISLEPIDAAVARIKSVLAAFDLRAELAPVDQVFSQVLTTIDDFSPAKLVEPLESRVRAARDKVSSELKLDTWKPSLAELVRQAQALIDRFEPDVFDELVRAAFAEAETLLLSLPNFKLNGGIGELIMTLLSGTGLRVHPWTFEVVIAWLFEGGGAAALAARTARIGDAIETTQKAARSIDLDGLAAETGSKAAQVRSAITSLPASDTRSALEGLAKRLDPAARLAVVSGNRARYLTRLDAAAGSTAALRAFGMSEVDTATNRLGQAFAPLRVVGDFFRSLLKPLGIGLDGGLVDAIRGFLSVARPERLLAIVQPILLAAQDRVKVLIDALVAPLEQGIDRLTELLAALDLGPLREGLEQVHGEVRKQVEALNPLKILAPTLDAFDALKQQLATFDPLQPVHEVLDAFQATVHRVKDKLEVDRLLHEPIRIYDDIVQALEALKLDTLLEPVLDQLDSLAGQIDEGLDRTVVAITRLQQALPEAGSGGASVAVGIA